MLTPLGKIAPSVGVLFEFLRLSNDAAGFTSSFCKEPRFSNTAFWRMLIEVFSFSLFFFVSAFSYSYLAIYDLSLAYYASWSISFGIFGGIPIADFGFIRSFAF